MEKLLIGGFGVLSGISGVSVGGWYAWNSFSPSLGSRLLREGYVWSPLNIEADISKATNKKVTKVNITYNMFTSNNNDGYRCFKTYFPSAELKFESDQSGGVLNTSFLVPSLGSSSPEGCTTMKLLTDSSDDKRFVFESETAIKNDKIGIVVRAFSKNVKLNESDNNDLVLQYTVLFLENTDSSWKVKWGGIVDEEGDDLSKRTTLQKVKIKSPDGKINREFSSHTNTSHTISWNQSIEYSGAWIYSDNGTSTVFKDIVVVENENKPSILGHDGNSFGGSIGSGTYLSANFIYIIDGINKWVQQNLTEEFKTNLNSWFSAFKNRKGSWINLSEECRTKSQSRRSEEVDKTFLKKYCYKTK